MNTKEKLAVLFLSSEVAPLAKTGGLADVSGSLPRVLAARGHDVRVAMPRYKCVHTGEYLTDLPVEMDGSLETAIVRKTALPSQAEGGNGLPVYLIDNYRYFYRDALYGFADDGARFNFFCKAVLTMLPRLSFRPQVIHCNDWQTALVPVFLKLKFGDDPYYRGMATLMTVHNLQYQGLFPPEAMRLLGLDHKHFNPEELEFWGQVNFLKGGLVYADLINTVSKKYALEIQTPELGEGLDGLLRRRAPDLFGVPNGLDYREFDPATDPAIYVNYDRQNLDRKKENKAALQKELGLPVKDTPLLGVVSRLVDQKGFDLLAEVAPRLLAEDLQLVILGSGEDRYQRFFSELQLARRDKVAVRIGFDPVLAQRIYAAADLFLMPSRFEPCGLGQLISMRYGTLPLVRATGGLEDTVVDAAAGPERATGFVFGPYEAEAFWEAIKRALEVYRRDPALWRRLQENAMAADFSWERSAEEYLRLYRLAIKRRRLAL
ncbi:MAG: glycogen synthase GlgA [Moorellales bacterium]